LNLLLVVQLLLGASALALLIHLWQEGVPDRAALFPNALKAGALLTAVVGISTVPLIALAMLGVEQTATITKLQCPEGNKRYVSFEYKIGDTTLSGRDLDNKKPYACESRRVGDSDTIVYLPSDPSVYVWRSPWPNIQFAVFASAFVTVGALVLAFRRLVRGEA
jgi:hypothetical protein